MNPLRNARTHLNWAASSFVIVGSLMTKNGHNLVNSFNYKIQLFLIDCTLTEKLINYIKDFIIYFLVIKWFILYKLASKNQL